MDSRSNKFLVKKNCECCPPRRVLSVINLTATDFIKTPAYDKPSKFPVIKPKISRRKSEIIKREQPAWIVHYREHVEKQLKLNRHEMAMDLRQKKVTFSFCEFLKKKEAELTDTRQKTFIEVSPAKYQD